MNKIEDTEPKEIKELVYFLLDHFDEKNSYVKIGKCKPISDNQIEHPHNQEAVFKRMGSCKTGNPRPLILLGYLYGEEKYWHNVFHAHGVDGEWFNYQPIKGIILNLRLTRVDKALEKWKSSEIAKVTKMIYKEMDAWNIHEVEKDALYKKLEKERTKIDRYTWDHYIKSYLEGRHYDYIDKEIIRNRFRTGIGQYDNNMIRNQHNRNHKEVSKFLEIMFAGRVGVKTKRKNSIVDYFNDIIHEGEPYYNLDGNDWNADGISYRNALSLWQKSNPEFGQYIRKLVEKDETKMRESLELVDRAMNSKGLEAKNLNE